MFKYKESVAVSIDICPWLNPINTPALIICVKESLNIKVEIKFHSIACYTCTTFFYSLANGFIHIICNILYGTCIIFLVLRTWEPFTKSHFWLVLIGTCNSNNIDFRQLIGSISLKFLLWFLLIIQIWLWISIK